MTTPAQRSALAALEAARPILMRLDANGDPEEVAADLIEGWSAVEAALRSLVGGSALSGQMLIRELRARHVITLEQANGLVEFQAARDRAQHTDYRPTEADVDAARQAFLRLEAGLMAASMTGAAHTPLQTEALPLGRDGGVAPGVAPLDTSGAVPVKSGRQPTWLLPVLGLVFVVALGAIGWWLWERSRGGGALAEGVQYYRAGQRERAQAAFERAAREEPQSALPHVYMSRMAREAGNLPLARSEAQRAVEVEPTSGDAMREMGSVLLTLGDYPLATRFYTRAIERDSTDKAAMGWMACALMRQGRADVAQRFAQRAGPGDWTNCVTTGRMPGQPMPGQGVPGQVMPGQQMPPGAYPPQAYPPGTQPSPQQQYPPQPPAQGTYIPRSP